MGDVARRDEARSATPPSRGADQARPEEDGPGAPPVGSPVGRVVGVVVLAVVAILATALAGPWRPPTRTEPLLPWEPPEAIQMTMPPQAPPLEIAPLLEAEGEPWDLTWLGIALLVVLVGWTGFLVRRWFLRHPVELPPEAPDDAGLDNGDALRGPGVVLPDLPALRAAVSGADLEVRRRVAPTEAVVAAWVHLEGAAGRSGVPRKPTQTPTEFTVDVLDRTPVDPAATRALLGLYLRARFGDEPMSPADVATALDALATLADGLGDPDAAHLDEVEVVLEGPDAAPTDPADATPGGHPAPADAAPTDAAPGGPDESGAP